MMRLPYINPLEWADGSDVSEQTHAFFSLCDEQNLHLQGRSITETNNCHPFFI